MTESLDSSPKTTAVWLGGLSARDAVRGVLTLAEQVAQWHASGHLHRAIAVERLQWPRDGQTPVLSLANTSPIEFGGPFTDPDQCPPELRVSQPLAVPAVTADARRALLAAGVLMAPDRIDVYQLGTLLCRLVSGQPIRAYLSSPATMSRVPKPVRRVIDGCIGYDESTRLETAEALCESLHDALAGFEGDDGHQFAARQSDVIGSTSSRPKRRPPPFDKLGHFEVIEEIGHGGMGVVYRGYDRTLDRAVALKVLHPRFSDDPAFIKRFKAEAAAAGKLSHPHLVSIYFIGEDAGRHFYAMQFVDGESLAERLHRVGRLSRDEVVAILQQVLLGLGAAHRQGFVHRDIKPGNILLDRQNGSAMLTDFGLARGPIPDLPHESDLVMGTAEYMSPEQAQGDRVDARSDLYSVGILLYQLLSGRTPFEAHSPTMQLVQHVRENPTPLTEVAPEVEAPLVRIVDRLLKKRPAERIQTVEQLLIELQQLPGQSAVISPLLAPSRAFEPVARPPRRWDWKWLIAVVLLLSLIWAFKSSRQQSEAVAVPLTPHADPVWTMIFSPNGERLISGGGQSASLKTAGDTRLRVWDASNGRLLKQSEPLPIGPEKLLMSDDGQLVVALGAAREDTSTSVVWDLETGRQEAPSFDDPFAFHFDAARLAAQSWVAAGNRGLVELSFSSGANRHLQKRLLRAWPVPLRAVCSATNANPPIVFAGTEQDGAAQVIEFVGRTFRERGRLTGMPGTLISLQVSSDGEQLITRSTETRDQEQVGDHVQCWSISKRERLWTRGPFAPAQRALSLSRDGSRVLTIAETVARTDSDAPAQTAVVIDVSTGRDICRLQTGSPRLMAAALSPDGSTAALGDASGKVVLSRLPPRR